MCPKYACVEIQLRLKKEEIPTFLGASFLNSFFNLWNMVPLVYIHNNFIIMYR